MPTHSTPVPHCNEAEAFSSISNTAQCGTNAATNTAEQIHFQTISTPTINGTPQGQFSSPNFKSCISPSANNDSETHNKNGKFTQSEKRTTDNLEVLFDVRLIALVIIVVAVVIAYKMVLVTVPYANTQKLWEASTYAQTKYQEAVNWANEQHLLSTLMPFVCGLAVAVFSFMLVYLDSNVPGINPPSPFSPKKKHYRQQRTSSMHLGYITSLAAGVVVTLLMYTDF